MVGRMVGDFFRGVCVEVVEVECECEWVGWGGVVEGGGKGRREGEGGVKKRRLVGCCGLSGVATWCCVCVRGGRWVECVPGCL